MRILHILDHSIPRRSDYATRTLALIEEQRTLGLHTIQLTGPRQGKRHAADRDGWHFFRTAPRYAALARLPLLQHLFAADAIAARLREVIKMTRPDLLHAHPPLANSVAALREGRRHGLPVLCEIGALRDSASDRRAGGPSGLRWRLSRLFETGVARRADVLVASCGAVRDDLLSRAIPAGRIAVIPAAVDMAHFGPPAPRDEQLARSLGLGDGPLIGFVGSFYTHEGLDLLLAAMPAMLRAVPGLRLLLVGSGPCAQQLKAQAARLELGQRVIFAGSIARDRAAAYYALPDILVYPRLRLPPVDSLTCARPLAAMAHARLVVASDVRGHRELISHGKTGILFEAGSAGGLAEAVLSLLAEPACWQPLGDAARRFVAAERSWSASAARYAPLYSGLLARKRPR